MEAIKKRMFRKIRFDYYTIKMEIMTVLISDIDIDDTNDKYIKNYWNDHDYKTFIETEYWNGRSSGDCDRLLKELQADDPISTYEIFKYVDKRMDELDEEFNSYVEEVSEYERKVSAFIYIMAIDWVKEQEQE